MDLEELARRIDRLEDAAVNGAKANVRFFAVIIGRLVKQGALTLHDLFTALSAEQDLIENLRSEGFDVQLRAVSLEQVAADLRETLRGPGGVPELLGDWRLDPTDPYWPRGTPGPGDIEPANQP